MIRSTLCGLAVLVVSAGPASAESTCSNDAQCPAGLVCATGPVGTSDSAMCPPCDCADGETDCVCDCEPADSSPSEPEQHCWFEPCETDAQCSGTAGFICDGLVETCTSFESPCACPPEEPDCECDSEPVEADCEKSQFSCIPTPMECTADSDCSWGWNCVSKEEFEPESDDSSSFSGSSDTPAPSPDPVPGKADGHVESICLPADLAAALPQLIANTMGGASDSSGSKDSDSVLATPDGGGAAASEQESAASGASGTGTRSRGSSGCSAQASGTGDLGEVALALFLGALAMFSARTRNARAPIRLRKHSRKPRHQVVRAYLSAQSSPPRRG